MSKRVNWGGAIIGIAIGIFLAPFIFWATYIAVVLIGGIIQGLINL